MNIPPGAGKKSGQYQQQRSPSQSSGRGSPSQSRQQGSQPHSRSHTPWINPGTEQYNATIHMSMTRSPHFQAAVPSGLRSQGVGPPQSSTQGFHVAQQQQQHFAPKKALPRNVNIESGSSSDVQFLAASATQSASGGLPVSRNPNRVISEGGNRGNFAFSQPSQLHLQYSATNPQPQPQYQYYSYPPTTANMSLSYESRTFMPDTSNYPQMDPQDHVDFKEHRYPSPPPPLSDNPYHPPQAIAPTPKKQVAIELSEMHQKEDSDGGSPGRSKPIPKPVRDETKDPATGKYYCAWPGCTEEIKEFSRKCEWSKHMDKHDRPYRCLEPGCEKLPGFTYSGGLLRHEREVHNKHGGPRKQLNCPHPNCKRHTGKGFSRQENLNEHLRRVHTDIGSIAPTEETEEEEVMGKVGTKRKRSVMPMSDTDIQEEMKRLKQENEDLRRQSEAQNAQTVEMMRQLQQLQHTLNTSMQQRLQAPQAPLM